MKQFVRLTSVVITSTVAFVGAGSAPPPQHSEPMRACEPQASGLTSTVIQGCAIRLTGFDNHASVPGDYTLTITGICPGSQELIWSGAAPNTLQAVLAARQQGSYVLRNGQCAGTQLGLGRHFEFVRFIPTRNGSGTIEVGGVGAAVCGLYVQLVCRDPCSASNVAQMP